MCAGLAGVPKESWAVNVCRWTRTLTPSVSKATLQVHEKRNISGSAETVSLFDCLLVCFETGSHIL